MSYEKAAQLAYAEFLAHGRSLRFRVLQDIALVRLAAERRAQS